MVEGANIALRSFLWTIWSLVTLSDAVKAHLSPIHFCVLLSRGPFQKCRTLFRLVTEIAKFTTNFCRQWRLRFWWRLGHKLIEWFWKMLLLLCRLIPSCLQRRHFHRLRFCRLRNYPLSFKGLSFVRHRCYQMLQCHPEERFLLPHLRFFLVERFRQVRNPFCYNALQEIHLRAEIRLESGS